MRLFNLVDWLMTVGMQRDSNGLLHVSNICVRATEFGVVVACGPLQCGGTMHTLTQLTPPQTKFSEVSRFALKSELIRSVCTRPTIRSVVHHNKVIRSTTK